MQTYGPVPPRHRRLRRLFSALIPRAVTTCDLRLGILPSAPRGPFTEGTAGRELLLSAPPPHSWLSLRKGTERRTGRSSAFPGVRQGGHGFMRDGGAMGTQRLPGRRLPVGGEDRGAVRPNGAACIIARVGVVGSAGVGVRLRAAIQEKQTVADRGGAILSTL